MIKDVDKLLLLMYFHNVNTYHVVHIVCIFAMSCPL